MTNASMSTLGLDIAIRPASHPYRIEIVLAGLLLTLSLTSLHCKPTLPLLGLKLSGLFNTKIRHSERKIEKRD